MQGASRGGRIQGRVILQGSLYASYCYPECQVAEADSQQRPASGPPSTLSDSPMRRVTDITGICTDPAAGRTRRAGRDSKGS
jgi:hypothetical protein